MVVNKISKRLLRRSNSEGELFTIPSLSCCLGFSLLLVYILRSYDLDGNSNSRKKLVFFLVFDKGVHLERGENITFFCLWDFTFFKFWVLTHYRGFCVFQSISFLISFPCSLHFYEFNSPKHIFHRSPVILFHDLFCSVFISTSLTSQIQLIPTWIYPDIPRTNI